MLLRDHKQIALNEIHALCIEVSDRYELAAAKACAADVKNAFLTAAHQHQAFAAEIATHIRKTDDQPKFPDPDKEGMETLISNVRLILANDEKQVLLDEQQRFEQKLMQAVDSALDMNFPMEVKTLLQYILQYLQSMKHDLDSMQQQGLHPDKS